ncbi:hypothetical protein CP967_19880 [Streptomyces nitrosporeus]|uniref:Uncharacterized protein n=1 Tax=Streptomyces nitrosporeus TaxID=28894 RepID=A0A5J6FG43_9ACTN|nr:hypothetical protein [Streptomyces nitrosporeus]QEU73950.1 hypothetical protein CP967_19880 [Streptomyces nitrosporeus]GGZ00988.1 hypothetical protein GCM10010327_34440 [Streptomyces nitrosporeus]
MTYGRAAIPALAGGLLLTALLWWAGASADALHLQGTTDALGGRMTADLQQWLTPWSYDPPDSVRFGAGVLGDIGEPAGAEDGAHYLSLHATGMQIRFAGVLLLFVPGALLLARRLPPVNGRMPALLLAVWAWGMVAGMLATAVSAPWLIASHGRGSYRFLPQLASAVSSGHQITVPAALLAAVVTALVARVSVEDAGEPPRRAVPKRAALLAATAGTAVVALSLVVLSYQPVAAAVQRVEVFGGRFSEPGELLRTWLLLGGWDFPSGGSAGRWLLYRTADVLLLTVVWCALRWLPGLLTRVTVPATAAAAVCATVIGLLASQLLHVVIVCVDSGTRWGLDRFSGLLGSGVPAALTSGLVAGVVAAAVLRAAGGTDHPEQREVYTSAHE